jgi:hypothetical protein
MTPLDFLCSSPFMVEWNFGGHPIPSKWIILAVEWLLNKNGCF